MFERGIHTVLLQQLLQEGNLEANALPKSTDKTGGGDANDAVSNCRVTPSDKCSRSRALNTRGRGASHGRSTACAMPIIAWENRGKISVHGYCVHNDHHI